MVLVDSPFAATTPGWDEAPDVTAAAITGVASRSENAALFFPRVRAPNPLQREPARTVRAVRRRRRHLSPAPTRRAACGRRRPGIDATLNGVLGLT